MWLWQFRRVGFYPLSLPQRHALQTQTVETVEKVPFQKLLVWKWEKNIEKRHVFVLSAAFWRLLIPFLSPRWEVFVEIFWAMGFSTVSLGWLKNNGFDIHNG